MRALLLLGLVTLAVAQRGRPSPCSDGVTLLFHIIIENNCFPFVTILYNLRGGQPVLMDQGPRGHQGASEVPPPAGRFTHSTTHSPTHPPKCTSGSTLFFKLISVLHNSFTPRLSRATFLNNHFFFFYPSYSIHIRSCKKPFSATEAPQFARTEAPPRSPTGLPGVDPALMEGSFQLIAFLILWTMQS